MIQDNPNLIGAIRDQFSHVDNCPFQGPRVFFENAGGALTLKSVVERSAELSANQGGPEPWGPGSIRYRDCTFSNQANPKLYGDVKESRRTLN